MTKRVDLICVGAVYISTLAAQQLPEPSEPPANQTELLAATIQPIVAFMVLISILIHGLSIPFFSLGRRVHSVSRTWSRHDTYGRAHAQPEWANMTRPAGARGEHIVINRDANDLERGVHRHAVRGDETPTTTEKMAGSDDSQVPTPTGTTVPRDLEKQVHDDEEEEREQEDEARGEHGEDTREANPPDGTEILAEWKEGPHKVIERRSGPGEEVRISNISLDSGGLGLIYAWTYRLTWRCNTTRTLMRRRLFIL